MYMKINTNSQSKTNKNNNISTIIDFILALSILSEIVFFCVNSLFGYVYHGSEASDVYRFYLGFTVVFNILIFLATFIRNPKMPIGHYLMLLVPICYCILGIITGLYYLYPNSNAERTIFYILIWQYTAILTAINIERRNNFIAIIKWLDIIMIICTMGLLRTIINSNSIGSTIDNIGGATYQSASYYAAFSFGLNLFFIVVNGKYSFKYLSNKFFKIIRYILLLVQILAAINSGGRGGIVLIVAYILFYIFLPKRYKIISKRKMYFIILIGVFTAIFLYPSISENYVFQVRLSRIFSYISDSGLDFSQTSGRDIIYKNFIRTIPQNPILGKGILSYYYELNRYPHNIILEVLFEGGICYFVLWLFIIIKLILKIHTNFHEEPEKTVIKVIALYPCVFLMFSGSYMINSMFWFVVTWAVLKSKKRRFM